MNKIIVSLMALAATVGVSVRAESYDVYSAEELQRVFDIIAAQQESASPRKGQALLRTVQSTATTTNSITIHNDVSNYTYDLKAPNKTLTLINLNGYTICGTNGTSSVKNGSPAIYIKGAGGMLALRNGNMIGGSGYQAAAGEDAGDGAPAIVLKVVDGYPVGAGVVYLEEDVEVRGGAGGDSTNGAAGDGAVALVASNNTQMQVQMEEGANIYGGAAGTTVEGTPGVAGALTSGRVSLQNFTYTFDTQSADTANTVIAQPYWTNVETDILAATNTSPVKRGYTFKEWLFKGEAVAEYPSVMISSNLTYVADWTVNEYAITWNYAEGAAEEGATYSAKYTVEDEVDLSGLVPVRTGYDFTGWTTNGVALTKIALGTIGDVEITANWRIQTYTIRFLSDTIVLQSGEYDYGEEVAAPKTPARAPDAQYTYTFTGWSPAFSATATGNVDYIAQYDSATRSYTITWDDGTLAATEVLAYGAMPSRADPVREGYTFLGWKPSIATVSGEATYTAQWMEGARPEPDQEEPEVPYCLVKYVDEDGTVLDSGYVKSGSETPRYAGETPAKPSTDEKAYAFSGWDPALADTVAADTEYTAVYSESDRTYSITWLVDGTPTVESKAYGAALEPADPVKSGYTFAGWSPALAVVTGDATYAANFVKEPEQDPENPKNYRLVVFKDADGNILQSGYYEDGVDAVTPPAPPSKVATDEYSYAFSGWDSAVVSPATADATYTAVFDETLRSYTVTWVVDDASETEVYDYGWTPSYSGTPAKASTATTDFVFTGWAPLVAIVTGDATYEAQFKGVTKPEIAETKATITWKDEDGTVLAVETLDKGSALVAPVTPAKAATDEYSYEFASWFPALTGTVEGDAEYTAHYAATKRAYAVTWVIEEETAAVDMVEYGTKPVYSGAAPAKASDSDFEYVFNGWTPALEAVSAEATYTATFKAVPKSGSAAEYAITWLDDEGKVLRIDGVGAADDVAYGATPLKASTLESDFVFTSWSPEVASPATESAVYTAVFAALPRSYTITWDVDGVLTATQAAYGATPFYPGATPEKAGYTFTGWSPSIAAVAGEATYEAVFAENPADPSKTNYLIEFKDDDGTVLSSKYQEEGSALVMPADPAKAATDEYIYQFAGWTPTAAATVTADAVYTATYLATKKSYNITWVVDGAASVSAVEYGQTPVYPGTLAEGFAGWTPALEAVTGEATYTAQFAAVPTQEEPYVITFTDEDGTILQTKAYAAGEAVTEPVAPAKAATDEYSYSFAGWTPSVATTASASATYKAVYASVKRTYAITWDVDNVKSVFYEEWGATPQFGADPLKEGYTFTGWSPEVVAVTGEATYTAIFAQTPEEEPGKTYYLVTFKDEGGKVLSSKYVEEGASLEYPATPVKAAADGATYAFSAWTPVPVDPVAADAVYTAVYVSSPVVYTITWIVDGQPSATQVAHGALPSYGPAPMLAGYEFDGWSPEVAPATENATYTAAFVAQKASENDFIVTFKDDNGKVLQTGSYSQGETVSAPLAPAKASTDEFEYAFLRWEPEFVEGPATADATYTAVYAATLRAYPVTWVLAPGSTVVDKFEFGKTPVYSGETPVKEGYAFKGWSPEIVSTTGAATYTAQFTKNPAEDPTKEYVVITWFDEDGTFLADADIVKGSAFPAYRGATPVKPSTEEYEYAFNGWKPAVPEYAFDSLSLTATYVPSKRVYTVTWLAGESGAVQEEYEYGEMPAFTGSEPAKEGFSFAGWAPLVAVVTGDAIYEAQFAAAATPESPYVVTYYDDDGTVLATGSYARVDDAPVPPDPVKTATDEYMYAFSGWTKTADDGYNVEYEAVYTTTLRSYMITWDVEGQQTPTQFEYGQMPVYPGATPAKEGFSFTGWSPEIAPVASEKTYMAQFAALPTAEKPYIVTFKDEDGTVLQTQAYGTEDTVTAPATPVKAASAESVYTFSAWSPAFVEGIATASATYTAVYAATPRTYEIVWMSGDEVLKTVETEYGKMPSFGASDPEAPEGMKFTGWQPAVAAATEDATYKAKFEADAQSGQVAVTFLDEDDSVILTRAYDEGIRWSQVEKPADPEKADTAEFDYTFSGWTPDLPAAEDAITESKTFKATYTFAKRSYSVVWKNYDGAELRTDTVEYGKSPAYAGQTPQRDRYGNLVYVFDGWSPTLAAVTGDVEYTAQFRAKSSEEGYFAVTWYDEDGISVLDSGLVAGGSTPEYAYGTPVKAATVMYTYTFAGWTPEPAAAVADCSYRAVYTATKNTYTLAFDGNGGSATAEITGFYGAAYAAPANPERTGYTFSGWSLDGESAVALPATIPGENQLYTALWTPIPYEIVFVNGDGTDLQRSSWDYDSMPSYTNSVTPTKASTDTFEFTFNGRWSPIIDIVTGTATYYAQFDASLVESTANEGYYAITWVNGDDETIEVTKVSLGETPEFGGETPTKSEDEAFTYTFTGWSPALAPAYGDATYCAQFKATAKQPAAEPGEEPVQVWAITWQNLDGKTLGYSSVAAGEMPEYTGETPVLDADAQYVYTFANAWEPTIVPAAADAVYTAAYTRVTRGYTIQFVNYDDTPVWSYQFEYGRPAEYRQNTDPTREDDDTFSYVFKGWIPELATVTGPATYKADYEPVSKAAGYYAVKWVGAIGETLAMTQVSRGDAPAYTGETPTKAEDAENTYVFSGWEPATNGVSVVSNMTFTAQFTAKTKKGGYITYTWLNADGTLLKEETVLETAEAPAAPTATQEATAEYEYEHTGWNQVTDDAGNVTYTATYTQTKRKYSITWYISEEDQTPSDNVEYGTDAATLQPAAPAVTTNTLEGTVYTFREWSPTPGPVVSNTTYTAEFDVTLDRSNPVNDGYYAITWIDGDGKTLEVYKMAYGDVPAYTNDTPAKTGTELESYTFNGNWLPVIVPATEDATYTAQFNVTSLKGGFYTATFVDWDGSVIKKAELLAAGTTPTSPDAPTREADAQYTYTFANWSPTVGALTGNTVYTATYNQTLRSYDITWQITPTSSETSPGVEYGTVPTAPIVNDYTAGGYSYVFKGWSPEVVAVTGQATYVAQYNVTLDPIAPENEGYFAVTWIDGNGATIYTEKVPLGDTPQYNENAHGTPTKADGELETYTFADDWTPAIGPATADIAYTALFTATSKKGGYYTATFEDWDGTVIDVQTIPAGTAPTNLTVVLNREQDAANTYEFQGWGTLEPIAANKTYTAEYTQIPRTYTITWKVDGAEDIVETDEYEYGDEPVYPGEPSTPVKAAGNGFTYAFREWTPALASVTGDATYTAEFTAELDPTASENEGYFAITWIDGNGKTLAVTKCPLGDTPEYPGDTPTKAETLLETYEFADAWSPALAPATANATYTAQFTAISKKGGSYSITWKNPDGTVLGTDIVEAGATPAYDENTYGTPVKASDAQYSYTYNSAKWTPEIAPVTGDATYTAGFDETLRRYTVRFLDWNELLLREEEFDYGATAVYNGETPLRTDIEGNFSFTHIGWSPALTTVTGPAEYIALYDAAAVESGYFAVTWFNYDGEDLATTKVPLGDSPVYPGVNALPSRPADDENTYEFAGWTPSTNVAVTADMSFTAQFIATTKKGGYHTVTWYDADGTVLRVDTVKNGEESGAAPATTQANDAEYTYAFFSWNSVTNTTSGNISNTAVYTKTKNSYTITWYIDTETQPTATYEYGDTPAYNGTPEKAADGNFVYTFRDWSPVISEVVSNTTYTAEFDAAVDQTRNPGYFAVTWVDGDGKTLGVDMVSLGDMPSYSVANYGTPTKTRADGLVNYTWVENGWSPALAPVMADVTYTAQFSASSNKGGSHSITWLNWDGEVIGVPQMLLDGSDPLDYAPEPTRDQDVGYTYVFYEWLPVPQLVSADTYYTAVYNQFPRKYTIRWVVGNVTNETEGTYGVAPNRPVPPTDFTDETYSYTFAGWAPDVVNVAGEATYVAQFNKELLPIEANAGYHVVTWVDGDGKEIYTAKVPLGEMPEYDSTTYGAPTKTETAFVKYTFADAWSPVIAPATADATYTALFNEQSKKGGTYIIRFVDWDGTELSRQQLALGAEITTPANPTREDDTAASYTFAGWDPAFNDGETASADATYTATYTTAAVTYTITWDVDDTEIPESYAYGATPSWKGEEEPTRAPSNGFSYKFRCWSPTIEPVTGNKTYTAQFDASIVVPSNPADPDYEETFGYYAITWVDGNGETLDTYKVPYLETPAYTNAAAPTKAATLLEAYDFADAWSPVPEPAISNATYVAQFTTRSLKGGTYAVNWVVDGATVRSEMLASGTTPAWTGENPTKAADAQYTYTFDSWDPVPAALDGNATYTAVFTESLRSYTITWVVDGTPETSSVDYGVEPTYPGAGTPTKANDATYSYEFVGWSPEVVSVTGEATYEAQFKATLLNIPANAGFYTVTWVDGNGKILTTDKVALGDTPAYVGDAPTKATDGAVVYTFANKWTPEVVAVTEDATYTALFTASSIKGGSHVVTFVNWDGQELKSDILADGAEIVAPTPDPSRAADAAATYTFTGWNPALDPNATASADVTYTAQFDTVPKTYDITWVANGETFKTDTAVAYGTTPTAPDPAPTTHTDGNLVYTFTGWSPLLEPVASNTIYVAQYAASVNQETAPGYYAVTWVDGDGKTLAVETYSLGDMPSYTGAETPTKSDGELGEGEFVSYQFNNTWTPAISAVTGDAIYTAQFDPVSRKGGYYTILWKDHAGEILKTEYLAAGETPTQPYVPAWTDGANNYTFNGWNPAAIAAANANATYTAQYQSTAISVTVGWKVRTTTTTANYNVGATLVVPENPAPYDDNGMRYTFRCWSPAPSATVTAAVTYEAQFDAEVIPVADPEDPGYEDAHGYFAVTWVGGDGKNLYTEKLALGDVPEFDDEHFGASIAKVDPAGLVDYTFTGWSPDTNTTITADTTFTAQFTGASKKGGYCAVSWVVEGETVAEDFIEAGTTTTYTGEPPVKAQDAQYFYSFTGWTPDTNTAVNADIVYKAQFDSALREYSITWDIDGTQTTEALAYGATPSHADPTKADGETYSYAFSGWAPTIAAVTGDATYVAQFDKELLDKPENAGYFVVTWVDGDGKEIYTEKVPLGDTPVYNTADCATPTKTATEFYTYSFTGWQPEVGPVYANTIYEAQFEAKSNKGGTYAITWRNWNGDLLADGLVDKNATPVYPGAEPPARAADAAATYTFAGWEPALAAATADATYVARYTALTNDYDVTFVNWNDEELQVVPTAYGTIPTYSAATPEREASDGYVYAFYGWTPELVAVTGEATYKAEFNATLDPTDPANEGYFTVTWLGATDNILATTKVSLGDAPVYTGDEPTKAEDEENTYTFSGWDPSTNGVAIVSNTTFKAQFTAKTKKGGYVTYTWLNADGTVIKTETIKLGDTPSDPTGVTQESTAEFEYTFDAWTSSDDGNGNITKQATYTSQTRSYNITWVDGNDNVIYTTDPLRYGTTPEYDEDTYGVPAKTPADGYIYTFRGWSPLVATVTGEATYTAEFNAALDENEPANKGYVVVTWVDGDNETIRTDKIPLGDVADPTGLAPTKTAGELVEYVFTTWQPAVGEPVLEDTTYTAQFEAKSLKGGSYSVTFVNWDGETLKSDVLEEGATIVAPAAAPTRPADISATYTFSGWEPAFTAGDTAASNVTYVAQYSATPAQYAVTWLIDNVPVLENYNYGDMPEYKGETPTKDSDGTYSFMFRGWTPEFAIVTGAATYTAQFDATLLKGEDDPTGLNEGKFAVTWVNGDGETLAVETYDEGETPTYKGDTPTKTEEALYSFEFSGWTPQLAAIAADTVFEATFTSVSKKGGYWAVSWVDFDGELLDTTLVKNNSPWSAVAELASPTRVGYDFDKWVYPGSRVVSDCAVTATYAVVTYTLSYVVDADVDNSAAPATYTIEATPLAIADPTRKGYDFAGWTGETVAEPTTGLELAAGTTGDLAFTATWTEKKGTPEEPIEIGGDPTPGDDDEPLDPFDPDTFKFAEYVKLTSDVTNLVFASSVTNLTLDLNGYTIWGENGATAGANGGTALTFQKGDGVFTVTNSRPAVASRIVGGNGADGDATTRNGGNGGTALVTGDGFTGTLVIDPAVTLVAGNPGKGYTPAPEDSDQTQGEDGDEGEGTDAPPESIPADVRPAFTLTVDYNDLITPPDTVTVVYGESIVGYIPATRTRKGSDFAGWDGYQTTMPSCDLTVTAKWTPKKGTPENPIAIDADDIEYFTDAECVIIDLDHDVGDFVLPAGLTNVVLRLNTFSITGATGVATSVAGGAALAIEAASGSIVIEGPGTITGGEGARANFAGTGGAGIDASGFAGTLSITGGVTVTGGKGGDANIGGTAGNGGAGVDMPSGKLIVDSTSSVIGGAPGNADAQGAKPGTPGEGATTPDEDIEGGENVIDGMETLQGDGTQADPYIIHDPYTDFTKLLAAVGAETLSSAYVTLILEDNAIGTVTVPAAYGNLEINMASYQIIADDGTEDSPDGKPAIVLLGNTALAFSGSGYVVGGNGTAGADGTGGRGGDAIVATNSAFNAAITTAKNIGIFGGDGGDAAEGSGKNGGDGGAGIFKREGSPDISEPATYARHRGIFGGSAGKGDGSGAAGTDGEKVEEIEVIPEVVMYTITWVGADGNPLDTDEVEAGTEPAYTGEEPVKAAEGDVSYVFAGWNPEIAPAASNTTYVAKFNPVAAEGSWVIIWNDHEGNEIVKTTVADQTAWDDVAKASAPARDGYAFDSWTDAPAIVTENVTVTAAYNLVSYKITYTLGDGADNGSNPASYTIEDTPLVISEPARQGYIFEGWTGESLAAQTKKLTLGAGTFGDVAFTAVWSEKKGTPEEPIDVGGDDVDPEDFKFAEYVKLTSDVTNLVFASTVTNLTLDLNGYTIWGENGATAGADGGTALTFQNGEGEFTIVNNRPAGGASRIVGGDGADGDATSLNGGNGGTALVTGDGFTGTLVIDPAVTLVPGNPGKGYTPENPEDPKGEDGKGGEGTDTPPEYIPDDYKPKYTLTFVFDDGATEDLEIPNIKYGDDITSLYPDDPTREGYTFEGWDPNAATMPSADLTITATWKTSGGDEPGPQPGTESNATAIDITAFTKDASGNWQVEVLFTLADESIPFATWAPTVNVYVTDDLGKLKTGAANPPVPATLDTFTATVPFDSATNKMTFQVNGTGAAKMFVVLKTGEDAE